jgi:hypothetical protein
MKTGKCRWGCGRESKNHSGISDQCWKAAAPVRAPGEAGYQALVCGKEDEGKRRCHANQANCFAEGTSNESSQIY